VATDAAAAESAKALLSEDLVDGQVTSPHTSAGGTSVSTNEETSLAQVQSPGTTPEMNAEEEEVEAEEAVACYREEAEAGQPQAPEGPCEGTPPSEEMATVARMLPLDTSPLFPPCPEAGVGQTQIVLADVEGFEMQVCTNLDSFFSNDEAWQRVQRELAGASAKAMQGCAKRPATPQAAAATTPAPGTGLFRVQVPKPYPGVQYRKSKRLDDRYPRFAEKGSVVEGVVEDEGQWLRTNGHGFLPMRVGDTLIIVPLNAKDPLREELRSPPEASWCLCCPARPPAEPAWPPEELLTDGQPEGATPPNPYQKVHTSPKV